MRAITKILLSTCAVCTIAQGHHIARAQPDQPTPEPAPPPTTAPPESPPATTGTPSTPTYHTETTEEAPGMYSYAWSDSRLQSGIGVSVLLGGGITGFTESAMRDRTSSVGGLWDLRVTFGSHTPLGLDVSYVGSATNIEGLPPGVDGTLIGTTVEGALRFNILPHYTWNPYIFAGVGWQRFDVTQTDVTLAVDGMNDSDDLIEFPMGVGVSYRMAGFVADLRGALRLTADEDLVLKRPSISSSNDEFASMHNWEASAALGYEF